ncbi:reverse transcriptase-like protein [Falsibacillus pallidus]|uniref:reverse transcriptase-like protein n=1 Tax=Falsibacillus pallidus TaxID=493781 RepID=UPI003D99CC25
MQAKIIWKYKGAFPAEFQSDWIPFDKVEKIINDLIKTGRVSELSIEDEMGNKWNQKEFQKLQQKVEQEPHDVVVYFDGGFKKEERVSGVGVAVYYKKGKEQWRVRENERLLQLESNNEAEYAALYTSLNILEELGVSSIPCTFKGDSQVVLNQLTGEWPCFDEVFNKWLDKIENKMKHLRIKANVEVISRNHNKEADKLAQQALDGIKVHSNGMIRNSDED